MDKTTITVGVVLAGLGYLAYRDLRNSTDKLGADSNIQNQGLRDDVNALLKKLPQISK